MVMKRREYDNCYKSPCSRNVAGFKGAAQGFSFMDRTAVKIIKVHEKMIYGQKDYKSPYIL